MRSTADILKEARSLRAYAASLGADEKNRALAAMAGALRSGKERILRANAEDLEAARGRISEVMLDRLKLDSGRIDSMASALEELISLGDPVGKVLSSYRRDDGLLIEKVSVPIGVTAIIYESRPNVTADAAALLLKSGNVCVLRGGKDAARSSFAITAILKEAVESAGLRGGIINIVEDTSRKSAEELMEAVGYVDLLIPRGGAGLISACMRNAKVPCIQTGTGICHIYVDRDADTEKALKIVENAKVSRPSVCNAAEVCLVDREIAKEFLPKLEERLCGANAKHPVELRLDEEAANIIKGTAAGEGDFDTEFLDYVLAVKIVSGVVEAAEHIAKHSTGHSEAIVTENEKTAEFFCRSVDSAAVYVNASTRFTDGGEFGLGCEMGISTQRLHARGPMGLAELTTYKYVIHGDGHIR